jgi:hypothetical protein
MTLAEELAEAPLMEASHDETFSMSPTNLPDGQTNKDD